MGTVSTTLPSDGQTIDASDVNTPINAILSEFNGNIDDNNIKTGANINGAKLGSATLPGTTFDNTLASGWLTAYNGTTHPIPSTVTYNGNRSYTNVYASSVASFTSEGMRKRFTRTVSAPTQCADLEASSSQYFSATSASLAGMTFTDDFVVSAWIKMESYAQMGIAGRFDATNGWFFRVESTGQLAVYGFNGGASNNRGFTTYQSIPLNKWVHVAVQVDMSTYTASSTTMYAMIDGVDVPIAISTAGTNPTSLIQAGNLNIGAQNASVFFDGKLAQVAIFGAKVTQATMRTYMSQGLSGTETSLVSAYSCSNSLLDLNTTNNNDLTANGGALMTNADSPFGNYLGLTQEYGIVTSISSDGLTETIQVPEGCALPTSGGISAVAYSTQSVPYRFPRAEGRWEIISKYRTQTTTAFGGTGAWYAATGIQLSSVPVGSWKIGHQGSVILSSTVSGVRDGNWTISALTPSGRVTDYGVGAYEASSAVAITTVSIENTETFSSATSFIGYGYIASSTGSESFSVRGDSAGYKIYAIPAYL